MPEIVVRPRKAGKTRAAIDWFLEDPGSRVIVEPTEAIANETRRLIRRVLEEKMGAAWPNRLRELNLAKAVVVALDPHALRGRRVAIFVDNADLVLDRLLGGGLAGASWNEDL